MLIGRLPLMVGLTKLDRFSNDHIKESLKIKNIEKRQKKHVKKNSDKRLKETKLQKKSKQKMKESGI